ncbi:MAG: amino acid permease [Planctomycetes bacterium]|nr:amino acid permease [Planctomycetota bacterium]
MPATPDDPAIPAGLPRRQLSLLDSTSIIVGIIIGSAIYSASPDIAAGAAQFAQWAARNRTGAGDSWVVQLSLASLLGVWLLGGLIALVGAMCYAELATAFPQAGGTYVFLSQAFGRYVGFAFAWAEFWIVRPGNVGAIGFVMARYARELLAPGMKEGTWLELLLAASAIAAITLLNAVGLKAGTWTQNVLTAAKIAGLAAIVVTAVTLPPAGESPVMPNNPHATLSLSLILVMFAYGGWADMSFVAAEVRDPARNISRALILGTTAVMTIYLLVTLAFVRVLGVRGLAASDAVAAEVMSLRLEAWGSTAISLLVIISCLGAINGTVFTGARVYYALGTHHPSFRWLGTWDETKGIPLRSLLVQAAATIGLVVSFGLYPGGFDRLVVFTTPFYWGFIALVAISLIVLRQRGALGLSGYRVPLYPVAPAVFFLSSLWMVYAAIDYAARNRSWEALWAVAVILSGFIAAAFDVRARISVAPNAVR